MSVTNAASYSPPTSLIVTTGSRRTLRIATALFYALIVAVLPSESFVDYQNYLTYSDLGIERLYKRWNQGVVSSLVNEPLWLLTAGSLGHIFGSELAVRIIIFFSAFTTTRVLTRSTTSAIFVIILILCLPAVIKNYLTHIRQGLAIAFFMIAWSSFNKPSKSFFFMLCSVLTHSSFFFVLPLYYMSRWLRLMKVEFSISFTIMAALSILLVFLGSGVAELMGARQATSFLFAATSVSGLGFLLWSASFFLFLTAGKAFWRRHLFEISTILLYLASYWAVDYSARVFESSLLVVMLAALRLPKRNKEVFFCMHFSLAALGWLFGLGNPYGAVFSL